jgi:hypothetical protein
MCFYLTDFATLNEDDIVLPTYLFKGIHARDFIVRFSHYLASFNNKQGRGPEFQQFC